MVADDIIGLSPPKTDELKCISRQFLREHIIRTTGEDYFITMRSPQQEVIRKIWKITWKKNETIRQFNQIFMR